MLVGLWVKDDKRLMCPHREGVCVPPLLHPIAAHCTLAQPYPLDRLLRFDSNTVGYHN